MSQLKCIWFLSGALLATIALSNSHDRNFDDKINHLDDIRELYLGGTLPLDLADFVANLSDALLENYVLVHTSQSLQPASPLSPRVITYHPRTKLIVAYSGLRNDYGELVSNNVELVQYDQNRGEFDFATIDFNQPTPQLRLNPDNCTTCHSASQHPIWFTYPLWPGAYDARDTSVPTSHIETTYFDRFVDLGEADPLYSKLVDKRGYFRRSPATSFNDFLNPINREFISQSLGRLQNFEPFKYAIAAALNARCRDEIEGFLPADLRQSYFEIPYEFFRENTEELLMRSFVQRFERFVRLNNGTIGEYPYYRPTNFLMQGQYRLQVSGLRYLLDQHGQNTHRLFFALDRRSFQTPWASALITASVSGVRFESCARMREKSLASLAKWQELDKPYPYWD